MPYFALTSWDIEEIPLKREVLFRDDIAKVWQFIGGRCDRQSIPKDVCGYTITEATDEESWDWDLNMPLSRGVHATEVTLLPKHEEMQAAAYAARLTQKRF